MPNPHFDIKIVQRSQRQSAVAGAAYQSGDNLFSEYDQKRKNYREKRGIMFTEIMLPSNAPPEYANRETLWNAVEAIEKQWNSQLARRFVLALPTEVPAENYPHMIKEYCNEHFVSKGMCCDFAIHDIGQGNPHCHIMLTLRAMDDNGKWLPKSRKVYDLDDNGVRIKLVSGNWKTHKEDTVDWNEQYHCEEWRHGWEVVQNKYLEMTGSSERVDLRSFARQDNELMPTIHMGAAVTQMERRGIKTNIGNLNREIKAVNKTMATIKSTIKHLLDWIGELIEKKLNLLAELETQKTPPTLPELLTEYLEQRRKERAAWSDYGQQQGALRDLKVVSSAIVQLKRQDILTVEKLDDIVSDLSQQSSLLRSSIAAKETRMKEIGKIENAVAVCKQHGAAHDKYLKIGWKTLQKKYADNHSKELTAYNTSYRYLKKQGLDPTVRVESFKAEYAKLESEFSNESMLLTDVLAKLKLLDDIRYLVSKVIEPELYPAKEKSEPIYSINDRLAYSAEQNRIKDAERKQKKKQGMER